MEHSRRKKPKQKNRGVRCSPHPSQSRTTKLEGKMKKYSVIYKDEKVYELCAINIADAIKKFATTAFITGPFEILTSNLATFAGYIIVEL
jgi:hypothetical protein